MYQIFKITSSPVVDFAAEELKKYLRMMMPRCGEIPIYYDPHAQEGFRLGLMKDFGLSTTEAADVTLDDILHIDTNREGGIIAGSNPRSVLQAVYRYLRENGCRWLFPGLDGEYIPIQAVTPTHYHKMADCRFRGQCNEGSEAQFNMLETIDFCPKLGLNVYMLEFDVPFAYYDKWYSHFYNDTYRKETVTKDTILQWKRMCEVEMTKRGLQFHDMGHGWSVEAFGFDSSDGWSGIRTTSQTVDAQGNGRFIAMINGKRDFYEGVPLNTNFCMSNPEARRLFANCVADYAQNQTNVDYLHIWLADEKNNHCECEECVKKDTADWYVILLNEIDEEFTRRGLDSRLVFIVYSDTLWPPKQETIHNPARYSLLLAPITRLYNESYDAMPDTSACTDYRRNDHILPRGMGETLAYLEQWKQAYSGDCMAYEYHFHWVHCIDPSYLNIAKRVHEDMVNLKKCGLRGCIQDMTQRGFFPNGYPLYVYAETLFDNSAKLEDMEADYFCHAYGKDWKKAHAYLHKLSGLFEFNYMISYPVFGISLESTVNPQMAEKLSQVSQVVDAFQSVIEENLAQDKRATAVCWQLLDEHREFCKYMGRIFCLRAQGKDLEAQADLEQLRIYMSPREPWLQRWFDHGLFFRLLSIILTKAYTSH